MSERCASPDPQDSDDREDDADPYTEWLHPVHSLVPASDCTPVKTRAPRSIFDLVPDDGEVSRAARRLLCLSGPTTSIVAARTAQPIATKVGDVTRCIGSRYPGGRLTPELEERERARRAKQRPPRPPKTAKTKGKKVLDWGGDPVE